MVVTYIFLWSGARRIDMGVPVSRGMRSTIWPLASSNTRTAAGDAGRYRVPALATSPNNVKSANNRFITRLISLVATRRLRRRRRHIHGWIALEESIRSELESKHAHRHHGP